MRTYAHVQWRAHSVLLYICSIIDYTKMSEKVNKFSEYDAQYREIIVCREKFVKNY